MAWQKLMYGKIVVAPISQFTCDEEADIADLPTNVVMGSYALVQATGNVYYMNSAGNWIIPGTPA